MDRFRASLRANIHSPRMTIRGAGDSRRYLQCFIDCVRAWTLLLIAAVGIAVGISSVGHAQDTTGMPKQSIPDKLPEVLEPGIRPDVIILRNANGTNILVPNSRYEEFERLLQEQKEIAANGSAPIGIERLNLDVDVVAEFAKVHVDAQVQLLAPLTRWQSLPIALGQLQWLPQSTPAPPSRITVSPDSVGYLWRLPPGAETRRTLAADALCKLSKTTNGSSIQLELPAGPCLMTLRLPLGEWDITTIGTGAEVVEATRIEGDKSVSVIHATGGTLTVSWNRKTVSDQIQAIEVESQTKFTPTTERGLFRAVTTMAIRGPKKLGGRRFLVTLPASAQWREATGSPLGFSGYRILRQEQKVPSDNAPTANSQPDASPVVLMLEFEESLSRSDAEIPIEWQLTLPPTQQAISFGVPSVEGIQNHSGTIEFLVPRDIAFRWANSNGYQLAKQSQAGDGSDAIVYRFHFDKQDSFLSATWQSSSRMPLCNSRVQVELSQRTLYLNGVIDFYSDPLQNPLLQLESQGWTMQRVLVQPNGSTGTELDLATSLTVVPPTGETPNNSVDHVHIQVAINPKDLVGVAANPNNPSARPNNAAIPSTLEPVSSGSGKGNVDSLMPSGSVDPSTSTGSNMSRVVARIEYRCMRQLPQDSVAGEFDFAVPFISWMDPDSQQRVQLTAGGELIVASYDSSLQEASDGLAFMERRSLVIAGSANGNSGVAGSVASGSEGAENLNYRIAASPNRASWRGTYRDRGAVVSANSSVSLYASAKSYRVNQSWKCVCAGKPPSSLLVELGPSNSGIENAVSFSAASTEFYLDGIRVEAVPIEGSNRLRLSLIGQKIAITGQSHFVLSMRQEMPAEEMVLGTNRTLVVPIAKILQDNLADRVSIDTLIAQVDSDPQLICDFAASDSPLARPNEREVRTSDSKSLVLGADQSEMRAVIASKLAVSASPIQMERVWIQSILNAVEQRERFVVRFRTNRDTFAIRIPSDRFAGSQFALNGHKATLFQDAVDPTLVTVELVADTDQRSSNGELKTYVFEMFSWPSTRSEWFRTIATKQPEIEDAEGVCPMVWQIIVPRTEHLIATSQSLSPGYRWSWNELWWARKSELTQDQIERDMGAMAQPIVGQQTNQYVLYSLDHNKPLQVWMVPRFLLWLPVSLCVLLGAVSLVEQRWMRQPWLWLIAIVSGVAFAQWAWDIAVVIGQGAIGSIAVAAIYYVIKWIVDRRARRRSVFTQRPTTVSGSNLHRSQSNSGSAARFGSSVATKQVVTAADSVGTGESS